MRVAVVFDLTALSPEVAGLVWQAAGFAAEEQADGRWTATKDSHGAAPRVLGSPRTAGGAVGEFLARTTPRPPEPVP